MRTDPSYQSLALDHPQSDVLVLTLNRPHAANAFDTRMAEDLRTFWRARLADAGDLRCIIVTGAGTRAFCAGADLKERRDMSDTAWRNQHVIFEEAFRAMMDCEIPIIAAVNGAAFGGGCEMVLAADFAYAADSARFALPETTLGIIPGVGGTQKLPRACGIRRASEILFTGVPFDAEQALAWNIVNRVVPADTLMGETLAIAQRISANAPIAVRAAKRALSAANGSDLDTGMRIEIECYNRTVGTEDRREGMRAFNEKRPPKYVGK